MSSELHDIALKMVDHILAQKGFTVLFSGQMTPSIKIEKIFNSYQPHQVYISSTFISDMNTAQAEFDKICYVSADHNARVFVGGTGFDSLEYTHPAVEKRLYTFEELFHSI